ncbi:MAG TPA: alcohol dehydrogenase catalytic domain-containing protein [Longimicrobiales bacterium]|nr:alcohol dehydrogenase catalytic domain-containing protein [Longimicrobiales bacterium]
MLAIRFHYRPARYLLTRWASRKRPTFGLGPLGCIVLEDVDVPPLPGPDWVRVETTLSGICGSDLAVVTAHDSFTLEPFAAYPFTFGHENVGRIAEVGAAVEGWSVGDRVVVNPMLGCVTRGLDPVCDACARGEYGLCRRTTDGPLGTGPMIGFCPTVGGGWSRYFVAHRSQLHRADGLPDEVAVLADPFVSALRPVLLHPPAEDDIVLVIGAGTIGALTVRALRLTGWTGTIAVLGRYPFQRELAERAGANLIFGRREELYRWAESLPGARAYKPTLAPRFVEGGPSLVYDTVGSTSSVRDALALTREGGRVVMVGAAARLGADWTRIWYRQLTLAGVFAYGLAPFAEERRDIYEISLELMRRDGFAELEMVTHIFDLEDYRAGLSAALDKNGHRSIKVAFHPGD